MRRIKWGAIIGFSVGYVLGAKAGRERYEQIRRSWGRVRTSSTTQRLVEKAMAVGRKESADRFDGGGVTRIKGGFGS